MPTLSHLQLKLHVLLPATSVRCLICKLTSPRDIQSASWQCASWHTASWPVILAHPHPHILPITKQCNPSTTLYTKAIRSSWAKVTNTYPDYTSYGERLVSIYIKAWFHVKIKLV